MKNTQSVQSKLKNPRRGAATVELAICLPVLVILVFGSIELSNMIYLKQALKIAAAESAKSVTQPGVNETAARSRAKQVLDARSIDDAVISISPAVDSSTKRGTIITVTVTAPANSNTIGISWYSKNKTLESSVVMVRM